HDPESVDEGACHTTYWRNGAQHLLRVLPQGGWVLTKDFDDDLPIDLRNALQHVIAYGLREAGLKAWDGVKRLVHLFDECLFGHLAAPLGRRFEIHKELGHIDHLWIGAIFGAASFGDDGLDFGKAPENSANLPAQPRRFAHRNAGCNITLIHSVPSFSSGRNSLPRRG